MSDSPLHSSWNSTDSSEEKVPVRSCEPASVRIERPAIRQASVRIDTPSANSMHLAAFTGIGLAIVLGAIFYLGTDSLRGSLTDGGGTIVKVAITAAGTFEPDSVSLKPGDELIITNENPNPQVLKSNGDSDLFVTQVLFDEPFSFIVPESAIGKTYVYSSETLPENQVLEIRVTDGIETVASPSRSEEDDFIPLPATSSSSETQQSSSESNKASTSSSHSLSSIPVVQESSESSDQPVVVALLSSSATNATTTDNPITLSLRPAAGASSSSSLPSLASNQSNLPNNPYTVSNRSEAERLGLLSKTGSHSSSLKSGANLRRVEPPVKTPAKVTKPRTNVETGPGPSMLIVTLLTMVLMGLCYRKMTHSVI